MLKMNKPADLNTTVGVRKWAHVINLDVIGPAVGMTATVNVRQKGSTTLLRVTKTHTTSQQQRQS